MNASSGKTDREAASTSAGADPGARCAPQRTAQRDSLEVLVRVSQALAGKLDLQNVLGRPSKSSAGSSAPRGPASCSSTRKRAA